MYELLIGDIESKTLQHAATHCNTLQHAATHCNTQDLGIMYGLLIGDIESNDR